MENVLNFLRKCYYKAYAYKERLRSDNGVVSGVNSSIRTIVFLTAFPQTYKKKDRWLLCESLVSILDKLKK